VTALPAATFDLITAFDAIHDQAAPERVLRRAHEALVDDGVFLVIDVKASSDLARNLDLPLGPYLYGVSVMHCMSVSLAAGGPGLGTPCADANSRRACSTTRASPRSRNAPPHLRTRSTQSTCAGRSGRHGKKVPYPYGA